MSADILQSNFCLNKLSIIGNILSSDSSQDVKILACAQDIFESD